MFRITPQFRDDEVVLKVEGCLAGPCVAALRACWRDAREDAAGRHLRIDLTDVCHVDREGRELMTEMYRAGVRYVARGCVMPEVVREVARMASAVRRF
jgi:hypothetical protein